MKRRELGEQVRNAYLSGKCSYRSLAKRYGCSAATIQRLMKEKDKENKPMKRKAARLSSSAPHPPDVEQAIPTEKAELQEALRMALLKIELLEAMIDIADEQMGANIRKKAGTSQS